MKLIKENSLIEFYEKKSRFIGYSFYVEDKAQADLIISELWKEHRKATHICTAIQLGFSSPWKDFDDDGEPSLTAGYPMLQILETSDIRQVLICAVRYFGGIKLGKGGLIRAYSKTAQEVVENSGLKEVIRANKYRLQYDYSHHGNIEYILASNRVLGLEPLYTDKVTRDLYLSDDKVLGELVNISDGKLHRDFLGEYYLEYTPHIKELEKV